MLERRDIPQLNNNNNNNNNNKSHISQLDSAPVHFAHIIASVT
jgi:hypothetical protein